MDFFDKMSKTVSSAAKSAEKKAGQLANTAKIKFALANMQTDLDELYEKLGRCRYEAISGISTDAGEMALIKKIDSLKADMELLKAELSRAKNERVCPVCKKGAASNLSFCPYCGSKLD